MVRVSNRLRLAALQARVDGRRQYDIARLAGEVLGRPLHPTTVSSLLHDITPLKDGDPRVLALGRVLGVPDAECFERIGNSREQD
jgi:hypothetical protein